MEDEIQTLTPPSTEGISDGTESQETAPVSEDTEQPQTVEQAKVEAPAQPTSSPSAARLRPSEYYEIRDLKKQIASIKTLLERQSSPQPVVPQQPAPVEAFDPEKLSKKEAEKYWADPLRYTIEREKAIREEMQKSFDEKLAKFQNDLPNHLGKIESEKQFRAQEQEALAILFPESDKKNIGDVKDLLAQFPERAAAIHHVINKYGLGPALDANPKTVAPLINDLLAKEFGKGSGNPAAPKKSQMAAVTSGSPGGGGKGKPTLDQLRAEKQKIEAQIAQNPELRSDPAMIKRIEQLSESWSSVAQ